MLLLKALFKFVNSRFKKFSNKDETCVWVHVLVLKNPENNHYLEWKAVSTTQTTILLFRVSKTGKYEEHFPQFKTWKPLGAPLSLHSVLYSTILYMLCIHTHTHTWPSVQYCCSVELSSLHMLTSVQCNQGVGIDLHF